MLTACAPYAPGSLVTAPGGANYGNAFTAGCVDVAVNMACDGETHGGAVIAVVDVGNRCDHGAPLDFTALAVFDGAGPGAEPMVVFDPRAEITAGRIAPHARAQERIEFDPITADLDPPGMVCVRARAMFDAGSREALCFAAASPGECPTRLARRAPW